MLKPLLSRVEILHFGDKNAVTFYRNKTPCNVLSVITAFTQTSILASFFILPKITRAPFSRHRRDNMPRQSWSSAFDAFAAAAASLSANCYNEEFWTFCRGEISSTVSFSSVCVCRSSTTRSFIYSSGKS